MSYILKLVLIVFLCESICDSMDRRRSCIVRRRTRSRGNDSGLCVINQELIFLNEELRNTRETLGQVIVVDSGCPRSLLGDKELDILKELVEVNEFNVKEEAFRFGPSRIYKSNKKVTFTMQIGSQEIDCEFFVMKGNIPILLGNDVMVPLGGKIDMDESKLVLKKADMEIPMMETKGGHFVMPQHFCYSWSHR